MSASDGTDSAFGVSHLGGMPITLTLGTVLLMTLVALIILRLAFGGLKS